MIHHILIEHLDLALLDRADERSQNVNDSIVVPEIVSLRDDDVGKFLPDDTQVSDQAAALVGIPAAGDLDIAEWTGAGPAGEVEIGTGLEVLRDEDEVSDEGVGGSCVVELDDVVTEDEGEGFEMNLFTDMQELDLDALVGQGRGLLKGFGSLQLQGRFRTEEDEVVDHDSDLRREVEESKHLTWSRLWLHDECERANVGPFNETHLQG